MAPEGQLRGILRNLRRRKVFSSIDIDSGNLERCLTRWDLTALGVGSTLGVGAYVIIGNVARNIAGPSIVLSFLLAALASLFAGLCYAEFGARVPKAGSAYIYSYVSVGEFVAFIIGWNLILEYMIGSASVARGLSLYVDSIFNGTMQRAFQEAAPIGVPWMSPYFDFFAFIISIILGFGLSFGMRESSSINNALSVLNISVVLFVIVAGAVAATAANWSLPVEELPPGVEAGSGGFFPYGVEGMVQGAAVCFYGFVGFDAIATTGEEVKEPRRAIPFAILLSLSIITLGYAGVSAVVTMMVPYYLQNIEAPLPYAFTYVGWEWARWVVAIGATFGLCASLFGAMFPLPRVIYSMASDGLIFRFLGRLSTRRRSPVVATMLPACLIAVMGAIFELKHLVSMMSIGTLLAYTIVAGCVLILRYGTDVEIVEQPVTATQDAAYLESERRPSARAVCLQLVGVGHGKPSRLTHRIVFSCISLYVCACVAMGVVRLYAEQQLLPMCSLAALALLLVLLISRQPRNEKGPAFQVPLVPLVPCLSIFANIYLMMMLDSDAWIKFLIWVVIGIPVYFLCMCMYNKPSKNRSNGHFKGNLNHAFDYDTGKSDKSVITMVVQAPTPPTQRRTAPNSSQANQSELVNDSNGAATQLAKTTTINNITEANCESGKILTKLEQGEMASKLQAERETQIIELLDQVLEAEEETYGELAIVTETAETAAQTPEPDARSELSLCASAAAAHASPTYDVVALVHREDLHPPAELLAPDVQSDEDELKNDWIIKEIIRADDNNGDVDERVIDEVIEDILKFDAPKGINEPVVSDITEEVTEQEDPNCATKTYYSDSRNGSENCEVVESGEPFIPIPPPMDEALLSSPNFKRSNTIIVIPRNNTKEDSEEMKLRQRTFSGSSHDDSEMVFGSKKQVNFMNKLNDMLQNKKIPEKPVGAKRSVSSSHILDLDKLYREETSSEKPRSVIMFDLKKELMARQSKPIADLKPIDSKLSEPKFYVPPSENGITDGSNESEEALDHSMSRQDLKSKLENIFASGGPKMLKPRLMTSNPPTPEPSLVDSSSSMEELFNSTSLAALKDKSEKADTLKLQKAKFGDVLNSFKITMAKDTNDTGEIV